VHIRSGFGFLAHIDHYRAATQRQAGMAGATQATFICRRCGQRRAAYGRRQVVKGMARHGFHCAHCVKERTSGANAPPAPLAA